MNSNYSEGTSVFNGLKMGVLTVVFGSIFATPITSFFLINTINGAFYIQTIDGFNIAIIAFTCIHGVFFNIIPYTLAGLVTIFFDIGKKNMILVGLVAMTLAVVIGIYFGNLIDVSEIKTLSDTLLALALCIALFFPYFLVFILLSMLNNIKTQSYE